MSISQNINFIIRINISLPQAENVDSHNQFSSLLSSIKDQLGSQYIYRTKHDEDSDEELSCSLLEREEIEGQQTENTTSYLVGKTFSEDIDKNTISLPTFHILSSSNFSIPRNNCLPSPSHQPLIPNHNQQLSPEAFRRQSSFSSQKRESQVNNKYY